MKQSEAEEPHSKGRVNEGYADTRGGKREKSWGGRCLFEGEGILILLVCVGVIRKLAKFRGGPERNCYLITKF